MSTATDNTGTSPQSGRAIALERRRALSQNGKAGLPAAKSGSVPPRSRTDSGRAAASSASVEMPVKTESGGMKKGCGCGCKDTAVPGATCAAPSPAEARLDEVCAIVEAAPEDAPGISTVRTLCRERRQALSSRGKTALRKTALTRADVERTVRPDAWKEAAANGATGHEIARLRREELCRIGRGNQVICRPSGRVRPVVAQDAPPKVEESSTLRGQFVTGTRPERSGKVTGNEPGSCRAITGTEYISSEQYETFCASRPASGVAKVGVMRTSRGEKVSGTEVGRSAKVTGDETGSDRVITGTEYLTPGQLVESIKGVAPEKTGITQTLRGQPVSGTVVGRSVKVTGDERGSCKSVTGMEYLSVEQMKTFCAAKVAAGPAKVAEMVSSGGQPVTGTEVGRSVKVTGDEAGSCLSLTGTQYYTPEQFGALCAKPGAGAPAKVGLTHTLRDRAVTGSEVGRSKKVTGDEYGGCKPITGTEYVSAEQYETLCESKPAPGAGKVGVTRTWHQQPVSGTQVGRSGKVTGDEYGSCKPITGTEYIGLGQYQEFCQPGETAAVRQRVRTLRGTPGAVMSGIQPGIGGKMTGNERGSCQPVSGTPYVGADQFAGQCPAEAVSAPGYAPGDFSIITPERGARERISGRVTGTVYGIGGRITGPVNLAVGLISGTPEFRYSSEETAASPALARQPVTGEGREAGRSITGDDWQRGDRVTGTEGMFSSRRNATMRGEARSKPVGARQFKEIERPAAAQSRVTGSSGSASTGAAITVSGGARG